MPKEVTLTLEDSGDGPPRKVAVRAARFTIGRGEDNDLRINDGNLSRRHAMVELLGGRPYLSDCGSSNGTTVNGQPVTGAVELYDGDLILLGNARALTVTIGDAIITPPASAPAPHEELASAQPTPSAPPVAGEGIGDAPPQKPSLLSVPVIAGAAIGLILLGAILLFALWPDADKRNPHADDLADYEVTDEKSAAANKGTGGATSTRTDANIALSSTDLPGAANSSSNTSPSLGGEKSASGGVASVAADTDSPQAMRTAIRRALGRMSTDSSPYVSEAGVGDVASKVREYRGSKNLAEGLRAMSRRCTEIKSLTDANSFKPAFLMYAALAQSEASGDPVETARQMMPKLLTLRATFGTETANSTLLLLAAYPYPFDPAIGSQTRTPHPLASKLIEFGGKRSVVETSEARSVWFLREKNAVTPEAYNLVVRALAIGVIAQAPRQYGIEADPLFC